MRSSAWLAVIAIGVIAIGVGALGSGCRSYFLVDDAPDGGAPSDASADATPAIDSGPGRRARIYVYGGAPDSGTLPADADVLSLVAEIQEDGMLGPWLAAARPPRSTTWHTAVANDDLIALLGGIARPQGGNLRIFIGTVEAGVVKSFTTSPDLLPVPLYHAASLLHGDALYMIGGEQGDGQPASADVWRGKLSATTYTALAKVAALPSPLSRMAYASSAGSTYLVGGVDQHGTETTGILRATVGSDGSLAPFTAQVSLPSSRRHAAAAVGERSLFVVGGQASGRDIANVLTCTLATDGSVEACTETTPLPERRSRHRAIVNGSRIYVVGGRGDDDASPGTACYVGDIDASGGVTSWRETTPLPTNASFATAVAF